MPERGHSVDIVSSDALDRVARGRGQTLAQMALSWQLQDSHVTSVLIGAWHPGQVLKALDGEAWSAEELARVDEAAFGGDLKAEN